MEAWKFQRAVKAQANLDVKKEQLCISKLISDINQYLASELSKLVDAPFYLFDTTKKVWANVASTIVPLTWDRYKAKEAEKNNPPATKVVSDPPAESGSRIIVFSDTNSTSDAPSAKAETELPPSQPSVTPTEDKALHLKIDSLISIVTELKASQSQDALVKEISELKKRVAEFEKKDFVLDMDDVVQQAIAAGLQEVDAKRATDAASI
ncbi:hypothetical protein L2E82_10058 [Cichorium intybus]|uniref:Uncharacterized protein n=1 Tax=Cichorium intybus TaxID=13427 RepID=A0ACB9G9I4_CICIN|nr:hypothetical protein L2E82_10058 [Cichorium intybus]